MKVLAARIILFYSTVLAIFVTVSGALTMKSIEEALFLLAFAPVFIYLVATSAKEVGRIIKKKGPSSFVSISGKKTEFIAGIVIFAVLIALGFMNLSSDLVGNNNNSSATEKLKNTAETTPIIFDGQKEDSKSLRVKITDNSTSVNLRSGPGTFNDIVGEASDGDEYEYTEVNEDWYKIDFEGKEAWIFQNYVEEIND
jgi:uncharacterized protein YgiM (DUF1202 family)